VKITPERQEWISQLVHLGYKKSEEKIILNPQGGFILYDGEKIILNDEEDNFWELKVAQYAVAENSWTPSLTLAELAKDDDRYLRRRVAENRSTPAAVIKELCRDQGPDVASLAMRNPLVSLEWLVQLLEDDDYQTQPQIKLFLAEFKSSVAVLTRLAQESESSVREAVAGNPKTPAEVLTLLAQQSESSVREAVARNPKTPAEVLTLLAQQSESSVLVAVAGHPNTSLATISLLVRDANLDVLEALLARKTHLTNDQSKELLSKVSAIRREIPRSPIPNPNVHERSWQIHNP